MEKFVQGEDIPNAEDVDYERKVEEEIIQEALNEHPTEEDTED